MKLNFKQGIVSYQTGGFLQVTGSVVNILATNRPVTVSIAHKNTNYTHSEDNSVASAWVGPFTETNYWLYWDFNPLTFERSFGQTILEPVSQAAEPGNGNADIVFAIPGDAGIGGFRVDTFYNLPTGKAFSVVNSTANNGNYTVKSISYNVSSGETTITVNEAVPSSTADGAATLDIDSDGNPLYVDGRHWYNTATNTHYILNGTVWREVLRVFAAQLQTPSTFISFSQNATVGDFSGTQIGNNNDAFSGRVLFAENSNAIRRDNSTFFTTEDQFFTNQARVDALRLESNVSRAQSIASTMAEFSVVAWTADGQIDVAQYDDVGNTVIGMLTEELSNLEVGGVITQGTVTNPAWNWTTGSVTVGATLWVLNGALVTVDPNISDPTTYPTPRVPVARVLDKDTIIFEQGLGGVGPQGPIGVLEDLPIANTTDLGVVTLLTPSSNSLRAFVISDTDSRLTDARSPLSHTHPASDVTFLPGGGVISNTVQLAIVELGSGKLDLAGGVMSGLLTLSGAPTAQLHATTKSYVDNLVNGLIWLEPIDGVNLIGDDLATPPGSPLKGDSYIIPTGGGSGDWTGYLEGEVAQWDDTVAVGSPVVFGAWVNLGPMEDIHAADPTIIVGIAMQSTTTPRGSFAGKKNQLVTFDASGNITGYTVPVINNAVYVDGDSSLYAFDQYAFDGIAWVKFGGSNQAITGDGLTTTVSGGTLSVIPAATGGQVDALFFDGETKSAQDSRYDTLYAPLTHTHSGFDVYDLVGQGFSSLANGDVIFRFAVITDFVLALAGHDGYAITAPTGSAAVFDVTLITSGSPSTINIGTLTFAPASQTPTLSGFTQRNISIGEILIITCTTASAIADVTISLAGTVGTI